MFEFYKGIVKSNKKQESIAEYLSRVVPKLGLQRAEFLSRRGLIKVNGLVVSEGHILQNGEQIEVYSPYNSYGEISDYDHPLDIQYEDQDLLILIKEAGMAVHPGLGNYNQTLLNALKSHFKKHSEDPDLAKSIVHRLDKETSGLMVVSKTAEAFKILSEQFRNKTAKRKYIALVHGVIKEENGVINWNTGRVPDDSYRFEAFKDNSEGKESITRFQVLERHTRSSLLSLELETGRTHQIRIHMNAYGFPLVNDKRYGDRKPEFTELYPYQMLFSNELEIIHPTDKKLLKFQSKIPLKMDALIKCFREV